MKRTPFIYPFILLLTILIGFSTINAQEYKSTSNEIGFVENLGQMVDNHNDITDHIFYRTESPGVNIYITKTGLTFQTFVVSKELSNNNGKNLIGRESTKKIIDWERIDMHLKNATILEENIFAEYPVDGLRNYFLPHCPNGIKNVKEYRKITIKDVYPKIDWVIYRTENNDFKYDFVIRPGGNYELIELNFKSKSPLNINKSGDLEMITRYGNIIEKKPISFINSDSISTIFFISKQIKLHQEDGYQTSIKFRLDLVDKISKHQIIIDPQLTWSTFFGSSGLDGPTTIDTDSYGNVFIGGYNQSVDFPVQDAGTFFQGTATSTNNCAFITKFDNNGNLIWSTYYGGSGLEFGHFLAVDNLDNIYFTGYTTSSDFPTQSTGTFFQGNLSGSVGTGDVFILKFDNTGNRLWATYLGGWGYDVGNGINIDINGNVFVTGSTESSNFPIYDAGTFYQNSLNGSADSFIVKFDNLGNLLWSTYYGGDNYDKGNAIEINSLGEIYLTGLTWSNDLPLMNSGDYNQSARGGGSDAFIAKFDNVGNQLWGTYYGGNQDDEGKSILIDNLDNLFFSGITLSTDFPVKDAGTFYQSNFGGASSVLGDVFIAKFDNLNDRKWATYFGDSLGEYISSGDNLAIDDCSNIYMSFYTRSPGLKTMQSADNGYIDSTYNGGLGDQVIISFNNQGSLLWSTFIGGDGNDTRGALVIDNNNNLYMCGEWTDNNNGPPLTESTYPFINPGGGAYFDQTFNGGLDDGVIIKFEPSTEASITLNVIQPNCLDSCSGGANIVTSICSNQYLWSSGSIASSIQNLCPGNYFVTVTDDIGDDSTYYFTIHNLNQSSISFIDTYFCQGESYLLPSGLSVSNQGVYLDTLSGSSINGCDSIITITLVEEMCPDTTTITPPILTNLPELIIPNVITPNNDQINDVFSIKNIEFYPENSLMIFDRWGNKLLDVKNYPNLSFWDGDQQSDGTYFYILKLNSIAKTYTGTFMLFR